MSPQITYILASYSAAEVQPGPQSDCSDAQHAQQHTFGLFASVCETPDASLQSRVTSVCMLTNWL
jgi:hypothetical protein